MDWLKQLADIDVQVRDLHGQSRDAAARYDLAIVNRLNEKISELVKRRQRIAERRMERYS